MKCSQDIFILIVQTWSTGQREDYTFCFLMLPCTQGWILNLVLFVFHLSSVCWQWQVSYIKEFMSESCFVRTSLSTSQRKASEGSMQRWNCWKIVRSSTQERRFSESLRASERGNQNRCSSIYCLTLGSLALEERAQGIQTVLGIYSSWFRGVMGELRETAQFPWCYKLFSL